MDQEHRRRSPDRRRGCDPAADEDAEREPGSCPDSFAFPDDEMAMLQVHRAIAVALLLVAAVADAQPSDTGVVVDVSGQKKGLYPIATPTAPDGDAAAEIAKVESFDLSVAGVFKVLDPKSFLADLRGEGL